MTENFSIPVGLESYEGNLVTQFMAVISKKIRETESHILDGSIPNHETFTVLASTRQLLKSIEADFLTLYNKWKEDPLYAELSF